MIHNNDKDIPKTPLTESEINYVKAEIQRIGADVNQYRKMKTLDTFETISVSGVF